MKYYFYNDECRVTLIYHVTPPRSLGYNYIVTREEPQETAIKDKRAVLYADVENNKLYYKYVDVEKTEEEIKEEEIKRLKKELKRCQQGITELTAMATTMLVPPMPKIK